MKKPIVKVALVTGGSSGIGREISLQLAKQGVFVIVNFSKSIKDADSVVQTIKRANGKAKAIQADISDEGQVKKMFAEVSARFGRLDFLINNAGIDLPHLIEDYPLDEWNRLFEVTLSGKFLCIKHAISLLKKSPGACIVNIASRLGQKPVAGISAYCSAEAGVIMLTKIAALELAKYKIRVNAVSPGLTRTPLTERICSDTEFDAYAKNNPCGRLGTTADIANAVLFLVSEKASFINGENINVSGGNILK